MKINPNTLEVMDAGEMAEALNAVHFERDNLLDISARLAKQNAELEAWKTQAIELFPALSFVPQPKTDKQSGSVPPKPEMPPLTKSRLR